jgi:hypothetical protein
MRRNHPAGGSAACGRGRVRLCDPHYAVARHRQKTNRTAAAVEGAADVGERSRRMGATVHDRAASAVVALRGRRRPPPWPWLVAGLGVGLVVGAAAGAVLARRQPAPAADADVGAGGEPAPPACGS